MPQIRRYESLEPRRLLAVDLLVATETTALVAVPGEVVRIDLKLSNTTGDDAFDVAVTSDIEGQAQAQLDWQSRVLTPVTHPWDIDRTKGIVFDTPNSFQDFGQDIVGLGDVNGDGIGDFAIGSVFEDEPDDEGERIDNAGLTIVFGGSSLGNIDFDVPNGIDAFAIPRSRLEINYLGDINADGINDFSFFSLEFGQAYLVFGGSDLGSEGELDLDGPNVLAIPEINDVVVTRSGASVGDVNNDGIDDFAVSGYSEESGSVGFVIFGRTDLSTAFFPTTLDGTNGFAITSDAGVGAGQITRAAGDFNGDGIDDLVTYTPDTTPLDFIDVGHSVIFGREDIGADGEFLMDERSSANSVDISGIFDVRDVHNVGDVNADGFDDLAINAENEERKGVTYLIYGSASPESLDVADVDGTNGTKFQVVSGGFFGPTSVSAAGDFDGDGTPDVLLGQPFHQPPGSPGSEASGVFVVPGSSIAGAAIDLTTDDVEGVVSWQREDPIETGWGIGVDVTGLGDVNGDGVDDIAFTAPQSPLRGQVFVAYGRDTTESGEGHVDMSIDTLEELGMTYSVNVTIPEDATGEFTFTLEANLEFEEDLDLSNNSATVTIQIEEPKLPGDINLDGEVSFADFLILSDNFGTSNVTRDQGDLNDDDIVDFADFLILSDNFGASRMAAVVDSVFRTTNRP